MEFLQKDTDFIELTQRQWWTIPQECGQVSVFHGPHQALHPAMQKLCINHLSSASRSNGLTQTHLGNCH